MGEWGERGDFFFLCSKTLSVANQLASGHSDLSLCCPVPACACLGQASSAPAALQAAGCRVGNRQAVSGPTGGGAGAWGLEVPPMEKSLSQETLT